MLRGLIGVGDLAESDRDLLSLQKCMMTAHRKFHLSFVHKVDLNLCMKLQVAVIVLVLAAN